MPSLLVRHARRNTGRRPIPIWRVLDLMQTDRNGDPHPIPTTQTRAVLQVTDRHLRATIGEATK
jgi:hypothetical protein